jgi:hypothetical protein
MGTRWSIIVRALAAVAGAIAPMTARGQEVGWSGSAEANASLLFGNASDRLIGGRLQFGRADSTLDVRTDSRFTYAEATDEDGGRRVNYRLTTRCWAEQLDRNRDEVEQRWGRANYRRFQIYLWGCVDGFRRGELQAYRLVMRRE